MSPLWSGKILLRPFSPLGKKGQYVSIYFILYLSPVILADRTKKFCRSNELCLRTVQQFLPMGLFLFALGSNLFAPGSFLFAEAWFIWFCARFQKFCATDQTIFADEHLFFFAPGSVMFAHSHCMHAMVAKGQTERTTSLEPARNKQTSRSSRGVSGKVSIQRHKLRKTQRTTFITFDNMKQHEMKKSNNKPHWGCPLLEANADYQCSHLFVTIGGYLLRKG